jgi:hypothetical protein
MEITDSDRISFLKKSMGKLDTRMRYNQNTWMPIEVYMLTFLDENNNYKMSVSSDLEEAIDNAIMKKHKDPDGFYDSVDHIPHSL